MKEAKNDVILDAARLVSGVLRLGYLFVAVVLLLLGLLTFLAHDSLSSSLRTQYGGNFDMDAVIWGFRMLLMFGILVCAIGWFILKRLSGIMATVQKGDPFVAENARRLEEIGWALLAFGVLDLVIGASVTWFNRLGVLQVDWSFRISDWLMVLLVFVLARVFRLGTRLRDDLDGTV